MQANNYGENEKLPKSIDLSHHLSDLAKARGISPLKGLFRYLGRPGMLALAGGLPHPDYFPFASLEAKTLPRDYYSTSTTAEAAPTGLSWFWNLFSGSSTKHMGHIAVPKYVSDPIKDVNLATALQYGMATGLPPLQVFTKEYTARFYKPGFSDFTTLVHTGNTDGWSRVVYSLLNPGDSLLVEEWTYPSALAAALPIGVHTVAAPLDSRGIKPDALREILANWDEEARGFKRPRLLYTVPIGQNPSGLTTGSDRKKQIYEICVEFDIIIGEDDPYYILQEGEYIPEDIRLKSKGKSTANSDDIEEFIESLEPSYLRYDYQGRVIRLDTFSKTIAPGCRMGWFTCNPVFAERFERAGETSTQAPSGFVQSLVTQLLAKEWGLEGYVRWLKGIKAQYTIRRDLFIDSIMRELDVTLTKGEGFLEGAIVYEGWFKGEKGKVNEKTGKKPVVSFVPPTSGMFVWMRVNFEGLPPPVRVPDENPDEATHEGRFWVQLAENNLLIGPGFVFRGEKQHPPEDPNLAGHYRVSFSDASHENMEKASKIFARVLKEYLKK
ncbi:PLP-dependent transferase [Serendipita vermifera]|nr:PLP-dependent transferase [Serendipita vermifera]